MNCPVCAGDAIYWGDVESSKTCEDHKAGPVFPHSGSYVCYQRCVTCGFGFAPEMMAWKAEMFAARIYNALYAKADPDYLGPRPRAMAAWLAGTFDAVKDDIEHLDYGGGKGLLSLLLMGRGFKSVSWDPFTAPGAPAQPFDLISAFEVFEHAAEPQALALDLKALLREDGVLVFSTLTIPDDIARPQDWWYAAPRNGHISLYTSDALKRLLYPLKVRHLGPGLHLAFATLPKWFPAGIQ